MDGTDEETTVEKYNPYLSRKFLITLAIIFFSGLMFFLGKLTESGYITITSLVFGGYVTANVSQKAVTK